MYTSLRVLLLRISINSSIATKALAYFNMPKANVNGRVGYQKARKKELDHAVVDKLLQTFV